MARSARLPLSCALACAGALALVAVAALGVGVVRVRDAAVLHGFTALDRPAVHEAIKAIVHLADPLPYAFIGLVCFVVALCRGLRGRALAVALLLPVTGATTQAIKHTLSEPRAAGFLAREVGPDAFPSGHATAAMTLALCAVLVAPAAWRATVALVGAAFAVGVGYGVVVLAWHFPSDVVGGFLVAGVWTSLAVAALRRFERPAPEQPAGRGGLVAAGVAAAVAAALVATLGSRADTAALYARERPSLAAAAVAIAALGLALVALAGAGARGRPAP
jgi:membrane-associated phospholipid phosphatase